MSYGNSYTFTFIFKNALTFLFNSFLLSRKKSRILNDNQIELTQYGICSSRTKN